MKIFEGLVCGFIMTAAAFGQASTPTPNTPQSTQSTTPPNTPQSNARPAVPSLTARMQANEPKPPEHPLTLDQMKQLYVAMGYDKTMDDELQTMLEMQKSRAPFIPQDVWDDFAASSKKVDYPSLFLPVYQKYLSTEEAAKVIDFSHTDAGKHFLETMPAASRELAMIVQKQRQQIGQDVQTRHKDEIEAAVKKYRDEHQPKPAPSLQPASPASPSSPSSPATPSTPKAPTAPSTPPSPQQ